MSITPETLQHQAESTLENSHSDQITQQSAIIWTCERLKPEFDRLREQNATLLAACKNALQFHVEGHCKGNLRESLKTAIAAAERKP